MVLKNSFQDKREVPVKANAVLIVVFFFIMFVAISCKNSVEKKPDNLVPKDKMIELLADIHRLEGHVNNLNIQNSDTLAFIYRKMESDLFKKHKIDTSAYYKSYKYYLVDPEVFTDLYNQVLEKIKIKNSADSTAEIKNNTFKSDSSKLDKGALKKEEF